jgi:hypothetical protein
MKIERKLIRKYVKAPDLDGQDLRVTIKDVCIKIMKQEPKEVLYFEEITQGLVLSDSNFDILFDAFGDETNDWIGKAIILRPAEFQRDREERVAYIQIVIPKPSAAPVAAPVAVPDAPPASASAAASLPPTEVDMPF